MTRYDYETLDVFTDRKFAGNQLAVIMDARGLTTADMLTITREFNYSETTFVLPPEQPGNTARVRIFTPTAELAFAGHPTIGTALCLRDLGRAGGGRIVLDSALGRGSTFTVALPLVVPSPTPRMSLVNLT